MIDQVQTLGNLPCTSLLGIQKTHVGQQQRENMSLCANLFIQGMLLGPWLHPNLISWSSCFRSWWRRETCFTRYSFVKIHLTGIHLKPDKGLKFSPKESWSMRDIYLRLVAARQTCQPWCVWLMSHVSAQDIALLLFCLTVPPSVCPPEREDERGGPEVPVRPQEVPQGRIWRRTKGI